MSIYYGKPSDLPIILIYMECLAYPKGLSGFWGAHRPNVFFLNAGFCLGQHSSSRLTTESLLSYQELLRCACANCMIMVCDENQGDANVVSFHLAWRGREMSGAGMSDGRLN